MIIVGLKNNFFVFVLIYFSLTQIFLACKVKEKQDKKEELKLTWFKTQVRIPIDTINHEIKVYYILKITNDRTSNAIMYLKNINGNHYLHNIIGNDTINLGDNRGNDSILISKQDSFFIEVKRSVNKLLRPNMSFGESLVKELNMTKNSSILYLMKDSLTFKNHNLFFRYKIPKDSLYTFEIIYDYSPNRRRLYYPQIRYF